MLISLVVQEVLELKSPSSAKGEESFFFYCVQKALFVLCSDNVWGLKFPADKENSRWVLSNHFLHAHAKACSFIYVSHKREPWLSLSCSLFLDSTFLVLSRHQRSLAAPCRRLIVLFSVSMQTPRLFSEAANIGAEKSLQTDK